MYTKYKREIPNYNEKKKKKKIMKAQHLEIYFSDRNFVRSNENLSKLYELLYNCNHSITKLI